jgi:hypothetical protein
MEVGSESIKKLLIKKANWVERKIEQQQQLPIQQPGYNGKCRMIFFSYIYFLLENIK